MVYLLVGYQRSRRSMFELVAPGSASPASFAASGRSGGPVRAHGGPVKLGIGLALLVGGIGLTTLTSAAEEARTVDGDRGWRRSPRGR